MALSLEGETLQPSSSLANCASLHHGHAAGSTGGLGVPLLSRLSSADPVLEEGYFIWSGAEVQVLQGCALYNNWWPMLTGLMYIMLPMPCLFSESGSSDFITSGEGGDWADAAKFLTGFSSVGSIAIPAILRHANLITAGAMWIEFAAVFILLSTVMIFHIGSIPNAGVVLTTLVRVGGSWTYFFKYLKALWGCHVRYLRALLAS